MQKIFFSVLLASALGLFAATAHAQMMQGSSASVTDWNEVIEHTVREEQEGKEVWDNLQAKEIACADLNQEQFAVLGEYFMGRMVGDSHAAMNTMMIQTHGEEGEEQIHIVMGKRLSGCEPSAVFPVVSGGWMPMMNLMWGGWSSPANNNRTNNMMNFGVGFGGGFGWIVMILWWVLIIVGIVVLVKWLMGQSHGMHSQGKSAVDILKERYAKGEINKQEFEDKKKDLGM